MPSRPSLHLTLSVALASLVAGCASPGPAGITIDRSITARSQDSRVQFLVLHYTAADRQRALHLLSKGEVSSHYLVTDDEPARVLQLVDENRRAWHVGASQWRGRTWLNASAIGIEIVNPGFTTLPDGRRQWHPYSDSQIATVIALVRDIAARHGIAPQDIVGHSDVAPLRKQDPGPLFPWARLAAEGLGRWYEPAAVAAHRLRFERDGLPQVTWFQQQLARLGYAVPLHGMLDEATMTVLAAFQMHYRPQDIRGMPDAETAAILAALA